MWATWNGTALRPEWDKLAGTELYAHPAGSGAAGTMCDTMQNSCFDAVRNLEYEKWRDAEFYDDINEMVQMTLRHSSPA